MTLFPSTGDTSNGPTGNDKAPVFIIVTILKLRTDWFTLSQITRSPFDMKQQPVIEGICVSPANLTLNLPCVWSNVAEDSLGCVEGASDIDNSSSGFVDKTSSTDSSGVSKSTFWSVGLSLSSDVGLLSFVDCLLGVLRVTIVFTGCFVGTARFFILSTMQSLFWGTESDKLNQVK